MPRRSARGDRHHYRQAPSARRGRTSLWAALADGLEVTGDWATTGIRLPTARLGVALVGNADIGMSAVAIEPPALGPSAMGQN